MTKLHAILAALCFSGCATAVSGAWRADPEVGTPATVMAAKACSAMPVDTSANVNPTTGWAQKLPAGMPPLSCATRYADPFYCVSPAACPGTLSVGTHPSDPADRGKTWHGLVDLLQGSILACAEQSNKFGVGSLECKMTAYSATKDKPIRIVLPVIVPPLQSGGSTQTSTQVQVTIKAAPESGPIYVGQIGFAELPSQ